MTLTVSVLAAGSEVDAAIGRAAVVLHLEGEAGRGGASAAGVNLSWPPVMSLTGIG